MRQHFSHDHVVLGVAAVVKYQSSCNSFLVLSAGVWASMKIRQIHTPLPPEDYRYVPCIVD